MSDEQSDAEIHSRIDRIEVTLTHTVDAIEKMASVVNKPQDTKWGPILTAVGLLFLAAGGYTNLVIIPMENRAEVLEAQVILLQDNQLEQERDMGRVEGLILGMTGVDSAK
jgi:hypothetical protein